MIGIIGGSAFNDFARLEASFETQKTAYGDVQYKRGQLSGQDIIFVPRHSPGHKLPPHKINYRANVKALQLLGVSDVIATQAIGGIDKACKPAAFIVPDQIIDYTWGRESTYFDDFEASMEHIDFTFPFDESLRKKLIASLNALSFDTVSVGTYACTQGPRLETAAEIERYQRDGATIVGMTVMPEAALAKELGLNYASLCFCVNWAAGIQGVVSMEEIMATMNECSKGLLEIIEHLIAEY